MWIKRVSVGTQNWKGEFRDSKLEGWARGQKCIIFWIERLSTTTQNGFWIKRMNTRTQNDLFRFKRLSLETQYKFFEILSAGLNINFELKDWTQITQYEFFLLSKDDWKIEHGVSIWFFGVDLKIEQKDSKWPPYF